MSLKVSLMKAQWGEGTCCDWSPGKGGKAAPLTVVKGKGEGRCREGLGKEGDWSDS